MEFKGLKCPVCHKTFEDNEDVVVCPDCGTPHHRECYTGLGHCFFEDRHREHFSYAEHIEKESVRENPEGAGEEKTKECPRCHTKNASATFYCEKCGFPLMGQTQNQQNPGSSGQNPESGPPPFGPFGGVDPAMFDPMAGINPDTELDEGVTAGEVAKFVQKNTPYFLQIFNSIKCFCKSRFNFSAFILSGAYLLYRKMYKIGTLFTVLIGIFLCGKAVIQTLPVFGWQNIYAQLLNDISDMRGISGTDALATAVQHLEPMQQFIFVLPVILEICMLITMFIAGFTANKMYFNFCTKKIRNIKAEAKDDTALKNKALETRGGVNVPIAVSIILTGMIVLNLPSFFIV